MVLNEFKRECKDLREGGRATCRPNWPLLSCRSGPTGVTVQEA